ncbi:MAG: hypothetical protein M3337_02550 [Actinomycetota bacterium]|nr:hypothetical protein [Actinomycetota bacterium]
MTGISARRRRATKIGAAAAIGSVVIAVGSLALGANMIYNSPEGQMRFAPERESIPLPATPNLLLGIVTDDDELAVAAVLTLSPAGAGGSIISIPANGAPVRPSGDDVAQTLRTAYADGGDVAFGVAATSMLGVSFDQVALVEVNELGELLEPVGEIDVELPADVVSKIGGKPSVLAEEGPNELDPVAAAEALGAHFAGTATDADPPVADENAAALWEGIADAIGGGLDTGAAVGIDVASGLANFVDRLWNGPVSSRGIASRSPETESDDEEGYVMVERNDVVLVFGQVSPRKLAAPLDGISVRLVVPFAEEDVSNADVALQAIDNLLFANTNVTSVSTAGADDGAPDVTRVEVVNADAAETARNVFPSLVGDVEVVDAEFVIPGIDVVITLGDSALAFYDGD